MTLVTQRCRWRRNYVNN